MKWLSRSAMLGAAWAAVLVGFLLAGVRLVSGGALIVPLLVLTTPAFLVTVFRAGRTAEPDADRVSGRARASGPEMWALVTSLPLAARVVAAVAFAGFAVAASAGIEHSRGVPGYGGGQYRLNNHGTFTVIDRPTYERLENSQDRSIAAVEGTLAVVAAFGCAAVARRDAKVR